MLGKGSHMVQAAGKSDGSAKGKQAERPPACHPHISSRCLLTGDAPHLALALTQHGLMALGAEVMQEQGSKKKKFKGRRVMVKVRPLAICMGLPVSLMSFQAPAMMLGPWETLKAHTLKGSCGLMHTGEQKQPSLG